MLVKSGADVNAKGNINAKGELNWRPLHFSAQNGTEAAAKILIANEADIEATNVDGDTPLQVAVENSKENVFMFNF